MIVLKIVVRVVRLLNAEATPRGLAAAVVLGLGLGLMPLLTPQALLLVLPILFFRVNLTAAVLSAVAFTFAGRGLAGPLDAFGGALLGLETLRPLWAFLAHAPVLWLCRLNHTVALGSTVAFLLLAGPVFLGVAGLVSLYRAGIRDRLADGPVGGFVKSLGVYRLYRRLATPLW